MSALHKVESQKDDGFVFTSESVSEGHPDKVCDQVSDAILDAYLEQEPMSRVACETLITQDRLILAGEISSKTQVDVAAIARDVIRRIGYVHPDKGFDYNCQIYNYLHQQERALEENDGAGDQGLMFGYACRQTKHLMPIPIVLSHKLLQHLARVRKDRTIDALLPDAKSQVTFHFDNRRPVKLDTIVLSTHHQPMTDRSFALLQEQIRELVIIPAINEIEAESQHFFETGDCNMKINPLGKWVDGGPAADTGLTGRKIIVDTYGGWAQHGGGAFSGKDPTKVDRSAAYMARHIAKSAVASDLAEECLVQFSFVIGEKTPVSLMVDTFGSGIVSDREIEELIKRNFNLTVLGIIDYLDLRKAQYFDTAAYGHFGRTDREFTWEKTVVLK